MVSKEKIAHLKLLPLEERAQMCKKCVIPDSIIICTFLFVFIGPLVGLYYWFIDEIVFVYDYVSPFWGFVLFSFLGLVIWVLCSFLLESLNKAMWGEYNSIIYLANKELISNIKNGHGTSKQFDIFISSCRERKTVPSTYIRGIMQDEFFTPKQQEQLRIAYIESMIGTDDIRQADFEWHTERVCWGCGKEHKVPPKAYTVSATKTQTWREGVYRQTRDFGTSAEVLLCPECYERLSIAKEKDDDFADIMEKTYTILGYTIIILLGILYLIILPIIDGKVIVDIDSFFMHIGCVLFGLFICWGLFFGVGLMRIVFLPIWIIASIINNVVRKIKGEASSQTKWNFNNIPRLSNFRSNNQRGLRTFK